MIEINDIKPIVDIPDFSIYIYYGLILFIFILLCVISFFIYKFFKPKKRTQEVEYHTKLKNLDFTNPKQTAYDISKYGKLLAKDERQIRLIEELIISLEPYKYKKNITTEITDEIKTKFRVFMESLDV